MRFARWLTCLCFVVLALYQAASTQRNEGEAAVLAATEAYRLAWLSDDPAAVMRTLTGDPVLLPSGRAAIAGVAAVQSFWWPVGGPKTHIVTMQLVVDRVSVSGDIAYTRGRGELTFTVESSAGHADPPTTIRSTFVNILRRQNDGRWLIAERMWNDLPPR